MITQVDASVWRGPRPTDFAAIKKQFAAVLSLEGLEEDAKELRELYPVPLVSQPISFWQIYATGISQTYLDDILRRITLSTPPVLVHCQHGEDRTGLVIAAYQVRVHGWTKEEAMKQALQFGFRKWLNLGLNRTWRNFNATE